MKRARAKANMLVKGTKRVRAKVMFITKPHMDHIREPTKKARGKERPDMEAVSTAAETISQKIVLKEEAKELEDFVL